MDDVRPFPMDPADLAKAISIPLEDWPANCHGVAEAVLRHAPTSGMRLVRGHYDGFISSRSVYRGGTQQHSWLRLQDGRILDPTRWAMDSPANPYIYCGVNDAYDEAGLVFSGRARVYAMASLSIIGDTNTPENAVQNALKTLSVSLREELMEAAGLSCGEEVGPHDGSRLLGVLQSPVEHIEEPEKLYRAAGAAGLNALIKIDCWQRVMEPGRVTPAPGVNFFYADPPGEVLTPVQVVFRTMAHFLSIEEREERIHDELEELGYTLDDLHDALNKMESCLKYDPDLTWMPRDEHTTLCHVAMDLLGKGFGAELRVERYADSLGLDRNAFDDALADFAKPSGLDLFWIYPPREKHRITDDGPTLSM